MEGGKQEDLVSTVRLKLVLIDMVVILQFGKDSLVTRSQPLPFNDATGSFRVVCYHNTCAVIVVVLFRKWLAVQRMVRTPRMRRPIEGSASHCSYDNVV